MTPRLLLLMSFVGAMACDSSPSPQNRTPPATASQESLLVQYSNVPFDTKELRTADFALRIPDAARIDSAGGNFPEADVVVRDTAFCPNTCYIAVRIHRGHSASLISFVDSIAKPSSPAREARDYASVIIDSVEVSGRQARWVRHWCGDCEWEALFVAGDGKIAEVGYNIDARDRSANRTKVLHTLASTFAWQ